MTDKQRTISVSAEGLGLVMPFREKGSIERPYLSYVFIEPYEKPGVVHADGKYGVTITATDGHILACYLDPNGKTNGARPILISDDFERSIKRPSSFEVVINSDEGFVRTTSSVKNKCPPDSRYHVPHDEVRIPKWKNALMPNALPSEDATLRCNPVILKRLLSAFPKGDMVALHPCTPKNSERAHGTGPIIARSASISNFFAVIMPMAMEGMTWDNRFPKWFKE